MKTACLHKNKSFPLYVSVDQEFNDNTKGNIGFNALLGAQTPSVDLAFLQGYRDRYSIIKSYQEAAIRVFAESLRLKRNPRVAAMILSDLPEAYGTKFHLSLSEHQLRTPLFFRTDEPAHGKCSEIQCPGSGWELAELIWGIANKFPKWFNKPKHFIQSPAKGTIAAMRTFLNSEPVVHHLTDNASSPHGMRYWIQKTRKAGARYFTYDQNVGYKDCNLIRSHDFVSLLHHNFFNERMRMCDEKRLWFDLPPAALFDAKGIMAWPFWQETRDAFSDAERSILPYTALIEKKGVPLADGRYLPLKEILLNRPREKVYFIKYAGTDVGINWGSRAVYRSDTLSRVQSEELISRIGKDLNRNRYWIIQEALKQTDKVMYWARNGALATVKANAKWSAFYGPQGLISLLTFHRRSHKVHGSPDTIFSLTR